MDRDQQRNPPAQSFSSSCSTTNTVYSPNHEAVAKFQAVFCYRVDAVRSRARPTHIKLREAANRSVSRVEFFALRRPKAFRKHGSDSNTQAQHHREISGGFESRVKTKPAILSSRLLSFTLSNFFTASSIGKTYIIADTKPADLHRQAVFSQAMSLALRTGYRRDHLLELLSDLFRTRIMHTVSHNVCHAAPMLAARFVDTS